MSDVKQKRVVQIEIVTTGGPGLKQMAAQIGQLNRTIKGVANSFFSLRGIFTAGLFGVGAFQIAEMADSMQLLENRIAILTGGNEKASQTMQLLLQTANRTKTSIDGLANIYARLAASTKETGISTEALLYLTEGLQNTFRLSGSTIQEATSAAIQLSQGFASGQLRGQELRSTLEANVVFGDLLSKSLGVTRGQIYKLAEAGKLTSNVVFKAFSERIADVNEQASKLGTTFEQGTTRALNNFKVALNDANKKVGASEKYDKLLQLLLQLSSVFVELGSSFFSAASQFQSLNKAVISAIPGLGNLYNSLIRVSDVFSNFIDEKERLGSFSSVFEKKFLQMRLSVTNLELKIFDGINSLRTFLNFPIKQPARERDLLKQRTDLQEMIDSIENLSSARKKAADLEKKIKEKDLANELANARGSTEVALDKRVALLTKLNALWIAQKITVSEYYSKLQQLDKGEAFRLLKEGKKDLEQFNEEARKIKEAEINRAFNSAAISMSKFNDEMEANKIEGLNEQLQSGKINLIEFDAELVKVSNRFQAGSAFRNGAAEYIKSIGTLSEQISGAVKNTFSSLEDALFNFTKNGKFNFKDFAQSVLDDLNRIIIRSLVIRPLAEGILNYTPSSNTGAGNTYGAREGQFLQSAKGNVFTGPTYHGYGMGKIGVLGEAGPEAVMPLKRGSDGTLGISASQTPVVVNINNTSGAEISQTETTGPNGEKMIDILISSKIREGLANGAFDRSFNQAFGLRRRGV
jgi:lambda family phage tail tape measure protein